MRQMSRGSCGGSERCKVFKGSSLISALVKADPKKFHSRSAATKFARRLFSDGLVCSVFGAGCFEDSVQLFRWRDQGRQMPPAERQMATQCASRRRGGNGQEKSGGEEFIDEVKSRLLGFRENGYAIPSYLSEPGSYGCQGGSAKGDQLPGVESEVRPLEPNQPSPAGETTGATPVVKEELSLTNLVSVRYGDHVPTGRVLVDRDGVLNALSQWPDQTSCSYSDNEKQLLEEMKRMKKEHQHVLKTYEDRINKLMARMHELRNIAEMLENSSTKSLPYSGELPGRSVLNLPGSKVDQDRKFEEASQVLDSEVAPPPVPPREDRDKGIHPRKPAVHSKTKLKFLPRSAVTSSKEQENRDSLWNTMQSLPVSTDDVDRLFEDSPSNENGTLYHDVLAQSSRRNSQPVMLLNSPDKTQQLAHLMKNLGCSVKELVHCVLFLSPETLPDGDSNHLLEFFHVASSICSVEAKQHGTKRGHAQPNCPDYLMHELSYIDNFQERLAFLYFKLQLLAGLFDTDHQLRDVHTACHELSSSAALRTLLEILLAVWSYLNRGTQFAQTDGFQLDILIRLGNIRTKDKERTLLEHVLAIYCQKLQEESTLPTCFRQFSFPGSSIMQRAAQVSFENVGKTLQTWSEEVSNVRTKIFSSLQTSCNKEKLKTLINGFCSAALETIEEQKHFLKDTKTYCEKTMAYFSYGGGSKKYSVMQFFQLWHLFLDDCHQCWTTVQLHLAKERFRKGFQQKLNLLSASSEKRGKCSSELATPKLPPRGKHLPQNEVVNASSAAPQIPTRWREDSLDEVKFQPSAVDAASGRKQPGRAKVVQPPRHNQGLPSPKPLTSQPPNVSGIHKPKARNAVNKNHSWPDKMSAARNYINQNPLGSNPACASEVDPPKCARTPPLSPKKSNQSHLNVWLAREQRRQLGSEDPSKESSRLDKQTGEGTVVANAARPSARDAGRTRNADVRIRNSAFENCKSPRKIYVTGSVNNAGYRGSLAPTRREAGVSQESPVKKETCDRPEPEAPAGKSETDTRRREKGDYLNTDSREYVKEKCSQFETIGFKQNRPRDRAPLVLGSNASISEINKSSRDERRLSNHENQAALRGNGSGSRSRMTAGRNTSPADTGRRKHDATPQIRKNFASGNSRSSSDKVARGLSASVAQARSASAYNYPGRQGREGQQRHADLVRRSAAMSAQSITSLIERFESVKHVGDGNPSAVADEGKYAPLASTPLVSRKKEPPPSALKKDLYPLFEPVGASDGGTFHHGDGSLDYSSYSHQLRQVAKNTSVVERYTTKSSPQVRPSPSPRRGGPLNSRYSRQYRENPAYMAI